MRSCKKARGVHFVIGPNCSNIHQGGHGSSFPWLCWLSIVCEQPLWFPNQNVQHPDTWTLSHLIQLKQEYKKLVKILIVIFKNLSRSKTLQSSSPVKHTSFAAPHKPSFGYYTQYGATSAGRTAKGSTTVSTNFISSTHEGMVTLANKHCHCLNYADA
jgi:hypothetical protein